MPHTTASGLRDSLILARAHRRERRRLAHELAGYATAADRDELAALIEGRGYSASNAADILSIQARRELYRAS
jgi:hypothetical protein